MRAKSVVSALVLLGFASVTALAWWQYQELAARRAEEMTEDRRTKLEAKLAALERRNHELEAELAAIHGGLPAAADSASDHKAQPEAAKGAVAAMLAVGDGGANAGESRRDAEFDVLSAMADLPEFQKLLALQQRGRIDSKYAALFRKLNLSTEDQAKLETLLADKQSAFADAMIAAHDQGLTGPDARKTALEVARTTQKDIDGSIGGMLGADGYKLFQNYERTMPQRETVNQLAQRLNYTASPLTPKQQDQLVNTLATAARQQPPVIMPDGKAVRPPITIPPLPGPLNGLGMSSSPAAVIAPAAVTRAQNFLSPAQLGALQEMQQEQQAQQTLNQLLRSGGKPAGPTPAPPSTAAPAPPPPKH